MFGRNAQPVADHRLVFVQPADELKVETVADRPVYKPGDDSHIRFHVTDKNGEGVRAALGLQIVDEAVFALAEKKPGFAKVFFYLEQEVMKPRYEIHSVGLPEIVEPVSDDKEAQRDVAARALFSATEIVRQNRFDGETGREIPGQNITNTGTGTKHSSRRMPRRSPQSYGMRLQAIQMKMTWRKRSRSWRIPGSRTFAMRGERN